MSGPYTPSRGRFAGQTFASHRQYRNALARAAGFKSEGVRRRVGRRKLASPSRHPLARKSERRALEALALMRREGIDLKTAARKAKTTPDTVIRHLSPRALRKGRDGRWHATKRDTIRRPMDMLTTVGPRTVQPRDSREASLIARHLNAVQAFLDIRPHGERELHAFRGRRAAGFEFETDLDTIETRGFLGEMSAESIYEPAK